MCNVPALAHTIPSFRVARGPKPLPHANTLRPFPTGATAFNHNWKELFVSIAAPLLSVPTNRLLSHPGLVAEGGHACDLYMADSPSPVFPASWTHH